MSASVQEPRPLFPDRFQEKGDEIVRNMFSERELAMTPEEYAARNAQRWGCFSYHLLDYEDAALGAWVKRLGEIMFSEEELDRCRRQYLAPQELAEVKKSAAEGL